MIVSSYGSSFNEYTDLPTTYRGPHDADVYGGISLSMLHEHRLIPEHYKSRMRKRDYPDLILSEKQRSLAGQGRRAGETVHMLIFPL